jgi:hypothetical protein
MPGGLQAAFEPKKKVAQRPLLILSPATIFVFIPFTLPPVLYEFETQSNYRCSRPEILIIQKCP